MGGAALAITLVLSLLLTCLATVGVRSDRPLVDLSPSATQIGASYGSAGAYSGRTVFAAPPAAGKGSFKEGHVIAKFKPAASREVTDAVVRGAAARQLSHIQETGARLLEVPAGAEQKVVEALKRNPNVDYAQPNYAYQALWTPNDTYVASGHQWNLVKIDAFDAWSITTGGNVKIAIVDTGISPTHPDLAGKVTWGIRYYGSGQSDANWADDAGHGTYVAGIASARTNNSLGVAGVSWGASLLAVKVLSASGTGYDFDVARGVIAATNQGARVINLSLAGPAPSDALAAAVKYAQDRGVLVVAASGNAGTDVPCYPAAYPDVLAVGATNYYDQHASYSSYGNHLGVTAPGGDQSGGIISTARSSGADTYTWAAGTSAAAPHVSGLAALIWSLKPSMSAAAVKSTLSSTADDLGATGWDPYYGWGRINAEKAAKAIAPPAPQYTHKVYVPLVEKGFAP